jgi:hypothetical protein
LLDLHARACELDEMHRDAVLVHVELASFLLVRERPHA